MWWLAIAGILFVGLVVWQFFEVIILGNLRKQYYRRVAAVWEAIRYNDYAVAQDRARQLIRLYPNGPEARNVYQHAFAGRGYRVGIPRA